MNGLATGQRIAPALTRYGSTAVAFHWAVAALVVFLGTLGLLFDDIPKNSARSGSTSMAASGLSISPSSSPDLGGGRRTGRPICRPTLASSIADFRLRRTISSMR